MSGTELYRSSARWIIDIHGGVEVNTAGRNPPTTVESNVAALVIALALQQRGWILQEILVSLASAFALEDASQKSRGERELVALAWHGERLDYVKRQERR